MEAPEPVNLDNLSIDDRANEEEYNQCTVELESGLQLKDLQEEKGVQFDIKAPLEPGDPDEEEYFDKDEVFKQLNQECLGDDEDDDENLTPFDKIALKMEDITPTKDRKVLKTVLKQGVGPMPILGITATIHYNCYLEYCDEPYDSTRLRNKPEKFRLGDGKLLPGMELALSTMKPGEMSKFLIYSEYAFGKQGVPPRIPPDATILMEIELLNLTDRAELDEFNAMSEEERKDITFKRKLHVVNTERKEGNDIFSTGNHAKALSKYMRGLRILDGAHLQNQEEEDEMKRILIKLCLNVALCALKLKQHGRVIANCRRVLDIEPKNPKALYRRGQAHMEVGEFEEAHKFLTRAKQQLPGDASIARSLQELDRLWKSFKSLERNFYSRMFPEWKKGPAKKDERGKISEEFKNMIREKLRVFQEMSSMYEMPFPARSLTSAEVDFLETVAKEMNMLVHRREYHGETVIKIAKPKPEKEPEQ